MRQVFKSIIILNIKKNEPLEMPFLANITVFHSDIGRCILSTVDHPAGIFIHGLCCCRYLLLRLSARHEDIFQSETLLEQYYMIIRCTSQH